MVTVVVEDLSVRCPCGQAGESGGKGVSYSPISQEPTGRAPHICSQVCDQLRKVPDAKALACPSSKEWSAKHHMFHGVHHTDPAGVGILLLPNREGITQVLERAFALENPR